MNACLICSAILVIVYFLLAFNVSLTRGATKTGIGSGEHLSARLNKAYAPRFIASLGTYLGGLALGGAMLMRALM
jgi:hypothetical protein